jgi:glycolate oxidase iron-sulfur subunit
LTAGLLADDLASCVHCGLCLQHCPTYLQTGQETESPRGRLHLIGAVQARRLEPSSRYAQHVELCLVCRACEAACPSGVPFGRIMEDARAQLRQAGLSVSPMARLLRWLVFRQLLPRPKRLEKLARMLRVYQRVGLVWLAGRLAEAGLLSGALSRAQASLPALPDRFYRAPHETLPAIGARRFRVGLFVGCVMPYLYPQVHAATVRVLRLNGCEVVIPRDQVCCGALGVHSGDPQSACELARRNLAAFAGFGLDVIVVNAAGCGSTLKEYADLLGRHDQLDGSGASEASIASFVLLVKDVHEILASIELVAPRRRVERRVTLQDSCHLLHAQRIASAPRQLLRSVPGLELVEMSRPDLCCGSAGSYSLTQPEMSSRLLDSKMVDILATRCDTIATANPGCMLQLEQGVRQRGLRLEVKHVVQLLDEAYHSE